jgi:hypothetical protein
MPAFGAPAFPWHCGKGYRELTVMFDTPKFTPHEAGTWRGSDIAAAAISVARSTLRVHMLATSAGSSYSQVRTARAAPLPADAPFTGRHRPEGRVGHRPTGYLLAPPEPEPDAPEVEPEELESPPDALAPDCFCVLLEAAAPVPPLSRQSFGICARLAYFDSSQRESLRAVCFLVLVSDEAPLAPAVAPLAVPEPLEPDVEVSALPLVEPLPLMLEPLVPEAEEPFAAPLDIEEPEVPLPEALLDGEALLADELGDDELP